MNDADLKAMIAAFTAEDESLAETIRKADLRRAKVRSILALLTTLDSDAQPKFTGKLADAIRAVLKQNSDKSMSPTEVRDAVKALGYEHPDEANLIAAIHGVLKRLHESRDARTKTGKDGATRYQWLGENQRPTAPVTFADLGRSDLTLPNSGLYNFDFKIPEGVQTVLDQLSSNTKLTEQMESIARFSEKYEPLLKQIESADPIAKLLGTVPKKK